MGLQAMMIVQSQIQTAVLTYRGGNDCFEHLSSPVKSSARSFNASITHIEFMVLHNSIQVSSVVERTQKRLAIAVISV